MYGEEPEKTGWQLTLYLIKGLVASIAAMFGMMLVIVMYQWVVVGLGRVGEILAP